MCKYKNKQKPGKQNPKKNTAKGQKKTDNVSKEMQSWVGCPMFSFDEDEHGNSNSNI